MPRLPAPDLHRGVAGVGPAQPLRLIRGHWRTENRLHYVRDVSFGEDASQVRSRSGSATLVWDLHKLGRIAQGASWY